MDVLLSTEIASVHMFIPTSLEGTCGWDEEHNAGVLHEMTNPTVRNSIEVGCIALYCA
jgi:hypothetical protein